MKKDKKSVGIHDGAFHADEVVACALLILVGLVDQKRIVRTRDPEKLALCDFVCDVGGEYAPDKHLFDHHQSSYQGPLSSAGMILKYLKERQYLPEDESDFLDATFVHGVDEHDNGRTPQIKGHQIFSHIISNFAPPEYDAGEEQFALAFHKALVFTIEHIQRMLERYRFNKGCRAVVKKAMEASETALVFERSLPWLESFFALGGNKHPAKFVIMPSGPHWKLRGIPPDEDHRMDVRIPLPQEWAGLLGDELEKVCHIPGAVFCHKGRFTSVWETKKAAFQALRNVLEKQGISYEECLSKDY